MDATLFDQVSTWLLNQWPIVVVAFVVVGLGFIPTIRDGVTTLWKLIPRKKRPMPTDPMMIIGEEVKFEVLMASRDHDVIRVLCHSHRVGVTAEHDWIERQYPKWTFVEQGLTSLEYLTSETEEKKSFFDSSAFFDLIVIRDQGGRTKKIFFDISEFFTGRGTSTTDPARFMGEKLRRIYERKAAKPTRPDNTD